VKQDLFVIKQMLVLSPIEQKSFLFSQGHKKLGLCNQLLTADSKEEHSLLTKAYDYDNVIMALEIQSHWYF